MKLATNPVGSISTYTTLVDESTGGVVKDWKPQPRLGSSQNVNLAVEPGMLNSSYKQPLGNITTSITAEITIGYGTRQAALAATRTLTLALLGAKFHLQVVEGAEIHYYPNCVCKSLPLDLSGSSLTFQLQVEGDLVQLAAP